MLDWLIIGGGIHGVHLACVLLGKAGFAAERLCILDPHERLLARWEICTAATGMDCLRSTSVHHVVLDPHDLRDAELELGPAARNIAGARHAGERLVATATS